MLKVKVHKIEYIIQCPGSKTFGHNLSPPAEEIRCVLDDI